MFICVCGGGEPERACLSSVSPPPAAVIDSTEERPPAPPPPPSRLLYRSPHLIGAVSQLSPPAPRTPSGPPSSRGEEAPELSDHSAQLDQFSWDGSVQAFVKPQLPSSRPTAGPQAETHFRLTLQPRRNVSAFIPDETPYESS